jgi:hypothetical protein
MKLKRWKAEAGMYAHGRFSYFFLKKSALKWLDDYSSYDILELTDRWKGKTTYLKDRLYGRADSPEARIIMDSTTGRVDVDYQDNKPAVDVPYQEID